MSKFLLNINGIKLKILLTNNTFNMVIKKMLSLSSDVRSYMINSIKSDRDKCQLLMTCKKISDCNFYFTKNINTCFIINLRWFDRFMNVSINENNTTLPSNISHLTICSDFNKPVHDYIPLSVTHLRLYCDIKLINKQLPSSIKYLHIDHTPDEYILKYLPSEVVELSFDSFYLGTPLPILYNELKKGNFPSSVKRIIYKRTIFSCNEKDIIKSIPKVEVCFEN